MRNSRLCTCFLFSLGLQIHSAGACLEASYDRMEITQLRLPTVDHYEPSLEDLLKAQFQGPGKDQTLDPGLSG